MGGLSCRPITCIREHRRGRPRPLRRHQLWLAEVVHRPRRLLLRMRLLPRRQLVALLLELLLRVEDGLDGRVAEAALQERRLLHGRQRARLLQLQWIPARPPAPQRRRGRLQEGRGDRGLQRLLLLERLLRLLRSGGPLGNGGLRVVLHLEDVVLVVVERPLPVGGGDLRLAGGGVGVGDDGDVLERGLGARPRVATLPVVAPLPLLTVQLALRPAGLGRRRRYRHG